MAELELPVKYKSAPARAGMTAMGLLMPVWALFVPFLLGQFIHIILANPTLNPYMSIAMILLLLAIPLVSIVISAICEDDRLLVSKEGLAFPLMFLPGLKFRRERLWSDLRRVATNRTIAGPYQPSDCLTLTFRSGGSSCLKLSQMSPGDIEQLLLAVEVWGKEDARTPELIELQNSVANENKGITSFSYTQMWEEELRRRFSATAFVPLEPGRMLAAGHLKIVRQLAFGGLSAIYIAQRNDKELVVVKEAVVPGNADADSRQKADELFSREARLLVKLSHPHIARVLDHFAEEGRNYLVLEYVNGQDLRQLVKQHGAQPEEKVLDWAVQMADILQYLHGQNPPVIHRDLTPDNLVLKDDGSLTLIDFGAANEFVGTATGTLVGKQSYIAPEQFRGKAVTQSDIYAFGCTLHYLLTGSDPEALSVSHPQSLVSAISPEMDKLVAAATDLEASGRPPTAIALRERLVQIMTKSGDESAGVLPAATTGG